MEFVLWLALISSFKNGAWPHIPKAYKTWTKIQNFTKLGENMFQMTLNKHESFHGDRTIGGAITVQKASKHSISKVNDPQSNAVLFSRLSRSIIIKKTVERVCVVCFCEPVVHFRWVSLSPMNQGWPKPKSTPWCPQSRTPLNAARTLCYL